MVNFYHRFVPAAASIMQPLYSALVGKPKELQWDGAMILAFNSTKEALSNATMLAHPHADAPIAVTADASGVAVGAVLEQLVHSSWQPLAFFSRQLRPAERKYSTFDRELLALHLTVRHFRYFVEGRKFTAFTDHKPLTFTFAKISDPWSARQQRHLTAISEYTTCIKHIAGKSNAVADALSRISINAVHRLEPGVDFSAMAAAQRNDQEMAAYRTAISGLVLKDIQFGPTGDTLLCDISTGHPRPVVPAYFRKAVFDAIHGLSHPFIRTTHKLLTFGMGFASTSAAGRKAAKLARRPKSNGMSRHHCRHSKYHTGDSTTSISTLWVHSLHHRGTRTYSLWLTGFPDGQKQFH